MEPKELTKLVLIAALVVSSMLSSIRLQAQPELADPQMLLDPIDIDGAKLITEQQGRDWLVTVDAGRYADSWSDASTLFQQAIQQEAWAATLEQMRRPLGEIIARELVQSDYAEELPGVPQGHYITMVFQTEFSEYTGQETVTLMLDTGREWRVTGYFIH